MQGAQAIRKSLEYKATGHHQFIIANNVRAPTPYLLTSADCLC